MPKTDVRAQHWQLPLRMEDHDYQWWDDLELPSPHMVHVGDLWLDPHGDELRGVVEFVAVVQCADVVLLKMVGQPTVWNWSGRDPIRVLRRVE